MSLVVLSLWQCWRCSLFILALSSWLNVHSLRMLILFKCAARQSCPVLRWKDATQCFLGFVLFWSQPWSILFQILDFVCSLIQFSLLFFVTVLSIFFRWCDVWKSYSLVTCVPFFANLSAASWPLIPICDGIQVFVGF